MKLFCLLVIIGSVAAMNPHYKSDYGRLTIDKVAAWTKVLEDNLQDVAGNISDAQTLCAVVDEELNEIYDFFIASITTENKQQFELISSYQAQVKTMQHKVDDAKAWEKEAISLAEATLASVTDQITNFLNGSEVKGENEKQQMMIDGLRRDLGDCKRKFITNLTNAITTLEINESEAKRKISILDDIVGKRKCEYGTEFLDEGTTRIYFKTKFNVPPNVTMSLTSFVAHLDKYNHQEDVLSLAKSVRAESTDFFEASAYDNSQGQADVKYLSCSWMACQFLSGQDVDLRHH